MTRSSAWSSLLPLCIALVVAGCNKQGPEAPVAGSTDVGRATAPAEPAPVLEAPPPMPEAAPNAVAVGGALGGNGAAVDARPGYAVGDTVFASVPTAGHAPGDTVRVYWTNADGMTAKEESGEIAAGEDFVSFEFSQADGMAPGRYNVQVDVNDVPVGIVDFQVE